LCKYHLDQIKNPWEKGTLNIREITRQKATHMALETNNILRIWGRRRTIWARIQAKPKIMRKVALKKPTIYSNHFPSGSGTSRK
jgi:hypothetical protein